MTEEDCVAVQRVSDAARVSCETGRAVEIEYDDDHNDDDDDGRRRRRDEEDPFAVAVTA